jgi:hypothetical protein
MFGEILGALAVNSSGSISSDDLTSRREEVEFAFDLIAQSMPFASSHSYDECVQHAICPNTTIRPSGNITCVFPFLKLYRRASR